MCTAFMKAVRGLELHCQIVNPDSFCILHIPNGQRAGQDESARAIAGAYDKRLGAMRGAPDYLLLWRDAEGIPFVGFLEAKSKTGELSAEQEKFRAFCFRESIPFAEFRSVEQGLKLMQQWGIIKDKVVI